VQEVKYKNQKKSKNSKLREKNKSKKERKKKVHTTNATTAFCCGFENRLQQ